MPPAPRLALASCCLAVARGQEDNWKYLEPYSPAIEWRGRTKRIPGSVPCDEAEGGDATCDAVQFDMPGVSARFRVEGVTAVSAIIQQWWGDSPGYEPSGCCCTETVWNSFVVYLDGVAQLPAPFGTVPRGDIQGSCWHCTFDTAHFDHISEPSTYDLVKDLDPTVPHDIVIWKDSEADFNHCEPWPNWVAFHGFTYTNGNVTSSPPSRRTPPKIEIIGGSTTCGYCNLCDYAPEDNTANILRGSSCDAAWSGILCRTMEADCHISAWSGMGVAVSLDSRALLHLPQVFPYTIQSDYADRMNNEWDFGSWVPDVVIIDLGSNDRRAWDDDGPDGFKGQYIEFVNNITGWYGEQIPILAGCGMTDRSYCHQVHDLVARFKGEGKVVEYLDLDNNGMSRRTCCGHPNVEDHGKIATWVTGKVEDLLGLEPIPGPDDPVPGPSPGPSPSPSPGPGPSPSPDNNPLPIPVVAAAAYAAGCLTVLLIVLLYCGCRKKTPVGEPLMPAQTTSNSVELHQ